MPHCGYPSRVWPHLRVVVGSTGEFYSEQSMLSYQSLCSQCLIWHFFTKQRVAQSRFLFSLLISLRCEMKCVLGFCDVELLQQHRQQAPKFRGLNRPTGIPFDTWSFECFQMSYSLCVLREPTFWSKDPNMKLVLFTRLGELLC